MIAYLYRCDLELVALEGNLIKLMLTWMQSPFPAMTILEPLSSAANLCCRNTCSCKTISASATACNKYDDGELWK